MKPTNKDYYAILGINRSASDEEIKKAFRDKAKDFHPDTTTDDVKKKELENIFKDVNEAYQVLSDPQERAFYDNPKPNVPPDFGFNPFHRAAGFGINIEELLRGGMPEGQQFQFHSQTNFHQTIEVPLVDVIMEKEVEIKTQIGVTIKFKLFPQIQSGKIYKLKISQDKNPNPGVIMLNLKINIIIPVIQDLEKKAKLIELLK